MSEWPCSRVRQWYPTILEKFHILINIAAGLRKTLRSWGLHCTEPAFQSRMQLNGLRHWCPLHGRDYLPNRTSNSRASISPSLQTTWEFDQKCWWEIQGRCRSKVHPLHWGTAKSHLSEYSDTGLRSSVFHWNRGQIWESKDTRVKSWEYCDRFNEIWIQHWYSFC